jgi:hypothetical protein
MPVAVVSPAADVAALGVVDVLGSAQAARHQGLRFIKMFVEIGSRPMDATRAYDRRSQSLVHFPQHSSSPALALAE